MTEILGVKPSKIRYGIQIFNDLNEHEVKDFWMRELNVSESQFLPKVVVTKSRGVGTYKRKVKYGVLTVYLSNTYLRKIFEDLMDQYCY